MHISIYFSVHFYFFRIFSSDRTMAAKFTHIYLNIYMCLYTFRFEKRSVTISFLRPPTCKVSCRSFFIIRPHTRFRTKPSSIPSNRSGFRGKRTKPFLILQNRTDFIQTMRNPFFILRDHEWFPTKHTKPFFILLNYGRFRRNYMKPILIPPNH